MTQSDRDWPKSQPGVSQLRNVLAATGSFCSIFGARLCGNCRFCALDQL